jgi:hypothetical protein
MCDKHNSIWVAFEDILLLLYTWNSCPVPGMDISRSLVAGGCKFAFLNDFLGGKHLDLMSSTNTIVSYSKELAMCLSAPCCEVTKYLVKEQHAYHCKMINAQRPDPCIYLIGNIVFAQCAVESVSANKVVDKL